MINFPNCKINLGLQVLGKRPDGYHDLCTIFYPLPVRDVLEVLSATETNLAVTGIPVDGDPEKNLCVKAWQLLKQHHPELSPVSIGLHKNIPMGAGLGGGSADGAFMLQLLNKKYQLGIAEEKLMEYALQLGSDCPFFIVNKPCLATGRGEKLTPVSPDLKNYSFLLVHPGIHVNTGWAFSQIKPAAASADLASIIQQPVEQWRHTLVNDFEAPVCNHYPEMQAIKDKLYNAGAIYASMTGSGSCFFGIFPKKQLPAIDWPATYRQFLLP
ncbi:4-(cytidine 5'-diphospho)-2-C-methyl-D-erythritol kinase [Pseudoflavitalea sp. G-6-1-2]|uniref:4-(cytidine 5'-diphospho)-2-C-methyl-D-erythritol kinase n=1 Tax=Pseudoflavitalea sp. G-6-1-2 TaxID=2728841 RepID=UPI00146C5D37|nr:4-(cytidine 5'-diphospho)-2-C-methyl-D-erythritol kinase [Pseudoflavitalea sp. G-6-1-2]NML22303.1 4-(cytidine 5'-diphospho)-2-C-methyl-D-erythritol kinase [Pseudoflavitalea sp. G-6-1-2]